MLVLTALAAFPYILLGSGVSVGGFRITMKHEDITVPRMPLTAGNLTINRGIFINLDRDVERRAWMEVQMRQFGLPFSRFAGINGSSLRANESAYVHKRGLCKGTGSGTVGNNLGHTLLWKQLAAMGDGNYLLMEDDIALVPLWHMFLSQVSSAIPNDWDILKLDRRFVSHCPTIPVRGKQLSGGKMWRLGPAVDDGCNLGLGAYIVRVRESEMPGRMQAMVQAMEKGLQDCITVADGNFQAVLADFKVYLPQHKPDVARGTKWLETDLFSSSRLTADGAKDVVVRREWQGGCFEEGSMGCNDFWRCCRSSGAREEEAEKGASRGKLLECVFDRDMRMTVCQQKKTRGK